MNFTRYNTSAETSLKYDLGLRAFMIQVFNFMTVALALSGIVAYIAGNSSAYMSMLYTESANGGVGMSALGWMIQLSPLFVVFIFSSKIRTMTFQNAQIVFWLFAVLMGLSLAPIFLAYTGESIARTFFVTASVFGSMSIYGYTTKRDLTGFGSFLIMGVFGIMIASLVNIFFASSGLSFAISLVGVLLFTGLTAYDVHMLKNMYLYSGNMSDENAKKLALNGALSLYLDFINLFIMLLRFMGNRRD